MNYSKIKKYDISNGLGIRCSIFFTGCNFHCPECFNPELWDKNYGGSCDNDVHEHFKALMETIFGKAFIHETEDGFETYNCYENDGRFICKDNYLKEWVIYSNSNRKIILNGKETEVIKGMNFIN